MWALYETGEAWASETFMATLDRLVPQTRGQACISYYGESCAYQKLCDRLPGWESPEMLGYLPRRPHHEPELAQAIGRGLLPPDEGLAEGVEE